MYNIFLTYYLRNYSGYEARTLCILWSLRQGHLPPPLPRRLTYGQLSPRHFPSQYFAWHDICPLPKLFYIKSFSFELKYYAFVTSTNFILNNTLLIFCLYFVYNYCNVLVNIILIIQY